MGIYLGPSPGHASYASLILNLKIVMVYTKLHFQHNDLSETIRTKYDNTPTLFHCQQIYEFKRDKPQKILPQEGV